MQKCVSVFHSDRACIDTICTKIIVNIGYNRHVLCVNSIVLMDQKGTHGDIR